MKPPLQLRLREFVRCELPAGQELWSPEPFPGSGNARSLGCTCPFDQPWPGAFVFANDCPVHELIAREADRPLPFDWKPEGHS